jgi:hypothetical protein
MRGLFVQDPDDGQLINISGDWKSGFPTRETTFSVSSALVEPSTAMALLRALEAGDRQWAYHFPNEDDEDRELSEAPYRLLGWIDRSRVSDELDSKDTRRNGVGAQYEYPGPKLCAALGLQAEALPAKAWRAPQCEAILMDHIQWSDLPETYDDSRSWRQRPTRSEGSLLRVSREGLRLTLSHLKMDLIVSAHIERRLEEEYGGRYGSETKKVKKFQKFFIFRANGQIECLAGSAGTWTRDRPPAQPK